MTILSFIFKFQKMGKSVFYHAGCAVCVSAEHDVVDLIGKDKVEVVHLGNDKARITEAENAGVKSVPALVTSNGHVLHINFGASMADVKG
jgi:glutaredoxin 3